MVAGGDVGFDGMEAVFGYELRASVVEHPIYHGYRCLWPGSLQQRQDGLADAAEADDDDLFDHADLSARNGDRPRRRCGACRYAGAGPGAWFYSFCLELPEMAKTILSRAMVAAKHARRPCQRRRYAEALMVTGLLAVWWGANGPSDE